MAKLFNVDESTDKVIVANQVLKRPDYVSPKEWLDFWERVKQVTRKP